MILIKHPSVTHRWKKKNMLELSWPIDLALHLNVLLPPLVLWQGGGRGKQGNISTHFTHSQHLFSRPHYKYAANKVTPWSMCRQGN